MNISTKTRYGFRLMIYLGLNEAANEPVQLGEIAEKENISLKYLEKIVQMLKKDGLVMVKRGPRGGYRLSRESRNISLLDVYNSLEGSCAVIDCCETGFDCERKGVCSTSTLWCQLSDVISSFFSERTLESLIMEHKDSNPMFYI